MEDCESGHLESVYVIIINSALFLNTWWDRKRQIFLLRLDEISLPHSGPLFLIRKAHLKAGKSGLRM
jgi:hypothetical protein